MRALAMLVGLVTAFAASYGAFDLMRAVAPANSELGSEGDLLQSSTFARAVAALEQKLGSGAGVQNLSLNHGEVSGTAIVDGRAHFFRVDSGMKVSEHETGKANLGAVLPLPRIDAAAVDKLLLAAREQSGGAVESLSLQGGTREWTISTDGEPDTLIANLDGGGVRISGEANPEPVAGNDDSLLRERNLAAVLKAAASEAGADARLIGADIRPDRATLGFATGGRVLSLTYGYDAQLTGRDVSAGSGDSPPSIRLAQIDPGAIERMARTTRQALDTKGLGDVNYVLLDFTFSDGEPALNMYLAEGSAQTYVSADLRGRGLTWPGKT